MEATLDQIILYTQLYIIILEKVNLGDGQLKGWIFYVPICTSMSACFIAKMWELGRKWGDWWWEVKSVHVAIAVVTIVKRQQLLPTIRTQIYLFPADQKLPKLNFFFQSKDIQKICPILRLCPLFFNFYQPGKTKTKTYNMKDLQFLDCIPKPIWMNWFQFDIHQLKLNTFSYVAWFDLEIWIHSINGNFLCKGKEFWELHEEAYEPAFFQWGTSFKNIIDGRQHELRAF